MSVRLADSEGRPCWRIVDCQGVTNLIKYIASDVQAQTTASGLSAEPEFEDRFAILKRDAGTCIANQERVTVGIESDTSFSCAICQPVDGVVYEVHEHRVEGRRVADDLLALEAACLFQG